jgi:hypothetical protein
MDTVFPRLLATVHWLSGRRPRHAAAGFDAAREAHQEESQVRRYGNQ